MAGELTGDIAEVLGLTFPSLHTANIQTETEAPDTNGGFLYIWGIKV